MPVKEVAEIWDGRSASVTVSEGNKYTRVFRVECTGNDVGPNEAGKAVGIQLGDQYLTINALESDQYAYCTSINSVQESTGDYLHFIVSVEYGAYSVVWAGGGPDQNPLLQPIDVEWGWNSHEVVADIDINGNPIVNTAGDPYDPPLIEDDPRPTMSVTRNEPFIDFDLILAYRNAINNDQFSIAQPYFCRTLNIQPKSVFHHQIGWYYQVKYEFEFLSPIGNSAGNINGFRRTVLNQGLNALSKSDGKPYRVTYKGLPVTDPVLLDKDGHYDNKVQPLYNVYQTKLELPFSQFNFDSSAISGQRSGFTGGYGPQG